MIRALRQVGAAQKVKEMIRKHGNSEQTYYEVSEARCLKELEIENRRLETLVANLSLDKQILKDALGRKW